VLIRAWASGVLIKEIYSIRKQYVVIFFVEHLDKKYLQKEVE
jgi:hypothetical protein